MTGASDRNVWRLDDPVFPLPAVDRLTFFGLIAVTAMLICYALERE